MPLTVVLLITAGVLLAIVAAIAAWIAWSCAVVGVALDETAGSEIRHRRLNHYQTKRPATGDAVTGLRESSRSGLRPVRQENVTSAPRD